MENENNFKEKDILYSTHSGDIFVVLTVGSLWYDISTVSRLNSDFGRTISIGKEFVHATCVRIQDLSALERLIYAV